MYIFVYKFNTLLRLGDSEETLRSSSKAATCFLHALEASHCVPFSAERLSKKAVNTYFYSHRFTRPGIEHKSTVLVVDALSFKGGVLEDVLGLEDTFSRPWPQRSSTWPRNLQVHENVLFSA